MDKYYIIKKQSKKEDRKAIWRLVRAALLMLGAFYGGMLLFFELMIALNRFSEWLF